MHLSLFYFISHDSSPQESISEAVHAQKCRIFFFFSYYFCKAGTIGHEGLDIFVP